MAFKDYFSDTSSEYARFRPGYPDELFTWLASNAPRRNCAWDCATGSGQAAIPLATMFANVIATDGSERQIAKAQRARNVRYRVAVAEASGIPAASVDLVTVAQALHWFDHVRFYAEVRRVSRDGALLAAWTYSAANIRGAVGKVIRRFHDHVVGAWWPPERALVESGYATLPFPFETVVAPDLQISFRVTRAGLVGYLGTWSATRAYRRETERDPLAGLAKDLDQVWPAGKRAVTLRMPLTVRAGRVRRGKRG